MIAPLMDVLKRVPEVGAASQPPEGSFEHMYDSPGLRIDPDRVSPGALSYESSGISP